MPTLNDLRAYIDESEIKAREQDKIVGQFIDHLKGLDPDTSLKFRAEALPEVGPRRPLARPKPATKSDALFIRG